MAQFKVSYNDSTTSPDETITADVMTVGDDFILFETVGVVTAYRPRPNIKSVDKLEQDA